MKESEEKELLKIWENIYEEEIAIPPKKRSCDDGWSRLLKKFEDNETYFTYQCYYWGTANIRSYDVATVENQWLTDESVNFCISYICSHSKWKDRILPFSSLFFAKLTSDPTRVARHDLVARWTRKNKDIFDKDVLLFVVHKNHHWSLIIVIKPYMLFSSENYSSSSESALIHVDSLHSKSYHKDVLETIMHYLWEEWKAIKQTAVDFYSVDDFVSFNKARSTILQTPLQENGMDCGVFTIHYAIRFVQRLEESLEDGLRVETIQTILQQVTQAFISEKGRTTIMEMIHKYMEQEGQEQEEGFKRKRDTSVVHMFK